MTAHTPTLIDCEDARDLLGAYALGILDSDEEAAVGRHLETCSSCRFELGQLEGVVDALGTAPAPVAPPVALRQRLLEDIQEIQSPSGEHISAPIAPVIAAHAPRTNLIVLPRWVVLSLAAAAVLLIAGVATLAVLLANERTDRDDVEAANSQLAAYLAAGGQVTKLLEVTDDGQYYGHGTLVTAPKMAPLVIVDGCSPTSDDRVYRVWVARGEDRTRVGELTVSGSGEGWIEVNLDESLDSFDSIGITMVTGGDQRQDVLVAQVNQSTPS